MIILLLKQEELTRVCGADAVAANLKEKNSTQLQSQGVEGNSWVWSRHWNFFLKPQVFLTLALIENQAFNFLTNLYP